MPAIFRVIRIRLSHGRSGHAAVEHELESPHAQPVVATVALGALLLDVGKPPFRRPTRVDVQHRPAAQGQPAALRRLPVHVQLSRLEQRLAHGPDAERRVHLTRRAEVGDLSVDRRRRHKLLDRLGRAALEDPVGNALSVASDRAAGRIRRVAGDPRQPQGERVGGADVPATGAQHGMRVGRGVELGDGRQPPFREVALVPAHRGDDPSPGRRLNGARPDKIDQLAKRAGLVGSDEGEVSGRLEQVLVGVEDRRQQCERPAVHHSGARVAQSVQAIRIIRNGDYRLVPDRDRPAHAMRGIHGMDSLRLDDQIRWSRTSGSLQGAAEIEPKSPV